MRIASPWESGKSNVSDSFPAIEKLTSSTSEVLGPTVYPNRMYGPPSNVLPTGVSVRKIIEFFNVQVSPQLPLSSFFGTAHQFTSRSPQFFSEQNKGASNDYQYYRGDGSKGFPDPLPRRFLIALVALFATGSFSYIGTKCIVDNNRRLLGWGLIGGGAIIGLSGMGLLWLSGFRSTWGWII